VECAAAPSCTWTGGTGGTTPFAAGDTLLWSFDGSNYNGPLSLSFPIAATGAGLLIQSEYPGQFTAQIQVGATTFVGTTTFTEQSDVNGDPIFIGVGGLGGATFSSVTLSLTACTGSCPLTDFAVDTLYTSGGPAAPEPGFFVPGAGVLLALVWRKSKRSLRHEVLS
jgi:hypothetical protein